MGRELKRVPLDFAQPLSEPWIGYLNPHYAAKPCSHCEGTGYSPTAKHLHDLWYGKVPFKPEDRGSTPFTPATPEVRAFAERNVRSAPEYYGPASEANIIREAERLCRHWNKAWCHHLNEDDVAALFAANRLMDFTHKWSREDGWRREEPPITPSADEVNRWSLSGFGHDSVNQYVVAKAECARLNQSGTCAHCDGDGEVWPTPEAKQVYEDWERYEPPAGEGYQIWETVSEGSPISPVFATPEALARHMATTRWGADKEGTSYETWLAFINGPGWAPSMVGTSTGLISGVEAVVELGKET